MKWLGIHPRGDFSYQSPIDLAKCLNKLASLREESFYVTSDRKLSTQQMLESVKNLRRSINVNSSYLDAADSCHIDKQRSSACSKETVLEWFLLSLSDFIVVQVTQLVPPREAQPISGYSYSAGIYSLKNNALVHGGECRSLDWKSLQKQSFGSWLCNSELASNPFEVST